MSGYIFKHTNKNKELKVLKKIFNNILVVIHNPCYLVMDNCNGAQPAGMFLPRIVLALQELVLRLASQSSSHEETNINTF